MAERLMWQRVEAAVRHHGPLTGRLAVMREALGERYSIDDAMSCNKAIATCLAFGYIREEQRHSGHSVVDYVYHHLRKP